VTRAERATAGGSPGAGRKPSPRLVLLWVLLVPLAIAVRLPPLGDSLWLDELHTSWTVQGGWSDVSARAANGNQGPVYFWSVWTLVRCLGESEFTLRLLSLAAGSLLVPAVAYLGFLWTRSAILATLAACLVVFDPHCVYFAREARPYALAQLLVVLHFVAFTGRLAGRRGSRLAWNLTLWLAFFTHCTAVLVVASELLVVTVTRWRRQWTRPALRRGWLQDLGLGIVVLVAAMPYLMQLAARRSNWEAFVPVPDFGALARLFACIPYVLVPLVTAWFLAQVAPAPWHACRDPNGPDARRPDARGKKLLSRFDARRWLCLDWPLAVLLAWYLVPAGLAWCSTRLGVAAIFFRRYLMVTAVAWHLFAAWCGLRVRPSLPRWLFAAIVLLAAAATHSQWIDFYYGRHSEEDWRSAVAWVRTMDPRGEAVLWLRPGLIEDGAAGQADMSDYLQFPVRGLYRVTQADDRVEILSRGWNGWSDREWLRLRGEPNGLLLARGTPESRRQLLARCEEAARERGGLWETLEMREFPSRLTAVRFRVVASLEANAGDTFGGRSLLSGDRRGSAGRQR